MNKRGFIIGLGAGLLIASCLSLIGYIAVLSSLRNDSGAVVDDTPKTLEEWAIAGAKKEEKGEPAPEPDNAYGGHEAEDSSPIYTIAEQEAVEIAVLTIDEDDTSSDIASKLYRLGTIKDSAQFKSYLDVKTLYVKYKPGTYEIQSNDTYDEILDKISKEQ